MVYTMGSAFKLANLGSNSRSTKINAACQSCRCTTSNWPKPPSTQTCATAAQKGVFAGVGGEGALGAIVAIHSAIAAGGKITVA